MSFPITPTEGEIHNKYIYTSGAWDTLGDIIESGVNYIKYTNGVLMQWSDSLEFPAHLINTGGSIRWVFPTTFIDNSYNTQHTVLYQNGSGSQGAIGSAVMNGFYVGQSTVSVTVLSHAYRESVSQPVFIKVTTIGRWK